MHQLQLGWVQMPSTVRKSTPSVAATRSCMIICCGRIAYMSVNILEIISDIFLSAIHLHTLPCVRVCEWSMMHIKDHYTPLCTCTSQSTTTVDPAQVKLR